MKKRILEHAQKEFFQSGFHRITMDVLARDLGVSKKTLYKHYSGKEALLEDVIRRFMDDNEQKLKGITGNATGSVIEKIHQIFTHIGTTLATLSPQFLEDIRRHAPHLWHSIDTRRMYFLKQYIRPLMETGMEEGSIREGIPADFIFLIYTTLVQSIINPETLSRFPISARQAFLVILQTVFQGMLTDDAQKEFLQVTQKSGKVD